MRVHVCACTCVHTCACVPACSGYRQVWEILQIPRLQHLALFPCPGSSQRPLGPRKPLCPLSFLLSFLGILTGITWMYLIKKSLCPSQWGSVGWALSCKLKGHWFDSWWGSCLGYGFGPWSRLVREAASQCFSPSLPFLLEPIKEKNK